MSRDQISGDSGHKDTVLAQLAVEPIEAAVEPIGAVDHLQQPLTAFHVGAFISIVFACYSLWHDIKYVPECDMTETNACKFCSKLHPPAHYTYCRLCEQCIRGQVFHSALLSCCVGLHNSFLYKVIAVYTLGASVIFTFLCVYALFNNSPASERDLDDLV
ncbi:uncharacterized protein LOC122242865 [Penaeus japonicus]|uniref:uncharacterized protein LOC122242865 n=1 Tax=Penaeus japonicus TaxID=27405 RepID=UPI001C711EA5|nr:uncharacterized protein LOC122242865 [Penaeus japonicus]